MNVLLLPPRMQAKIIETPCPVPSIAGDCWTWTGAVQSKGYGSFGYEGRTWSSHKLAYVLLVGPVPDGLELDHLCLNQLCCNPWHLEPVTGTENRRRARLARYPISTAVAAPGRPLIDIFDEYFGRSA